MSHFCRILLILAIGAWITLFISAYAYAADKYCVDNIAFSTQMPQTTLKPSWQKEVFPRYFRQPKEGEYPVVYDVFNVEGEDGKLQGGGKALWFFNAENKINGPYIPEFRVSGDMLSNASGDIVFVGSKKAQDIEGYEKRIFHVPYGQEPQPISTSAQEQLKWPQKIFFSNVLKGFLVNSSDHTGYGLVKFRTSLLRDEKVIPLQDTALQMVQDMPQYGITAILGFRDLSFLDQDLNLTHVTKLNPGDDYGGWFGIDEMTEPDWLYVRGAQYDHMIHLSKEAGKWIADKKIRIWPPETGKKGWFERFLGYSMDMKGEQIKRDELTDIVKAGACRKFSKALGRMIFCDEMQELTPSGLSSIPKGSAPWEGYDGDINKLKVAVLRDQDGHLYAYDGTQIHRIKGQKVRRGLVVNIANGRAFYNSLDGSYELRGDTAENLEAIPLKHNLPENSNMFFLRPFSMPNNDIFLFHRNGIYSLDNDKLVEFWIPPDNRRIDVTGHTAPIWIQAPKAILFTTRINVTGKPEILRFSICP